MGNGPAPGTRSLPTFRLAVLFFLSGLSALLYEVVWTKELAHLFGVTTYAIGTSLAVFMLGLALGSRFLGALAERVRDPLLAYAALEAGIAASAACSLALLKGVDELAAVLPFSGTENTSFTAFRLAGCFLVLGVPTFLMGGTLPLLSKAFVASPETAGARIGWLYAVNTLGGMAGCLLAGFAGIPAFGLRGTLLAGVAANALVSASVYFGFVRAGAREDAPPGRVPCEEPGAGAAGEAPGGRRVLRAMQAAFFISGFFSLAVEVVWTRALLLNLNATAQTFAAILGVCLAGLAAGGAVSGRLAHRYAPAPAYGFVSLLTGLSLAACMALWSDRRDWIEQAVRGSLAWPAAGPSGYALYKLLLSLGYAGALVFLPAFCMGFSFPLAGRFFARDARAVGRTFGAAYMLNTLGCMLGPLVFGFWLLPALGLRSAGLLCAAGFVVSGTAVLVAAQPSPRRWVWCAAGAFLLGLVGWWFSGTTVLSPTYQHSNGTILSYEEDVSGSVFVLEKQTQLGAVRQLMVGTTSMISDSFRCRRYTRLIGHLPVVLHPHPRRALVICLGSGMTLSAVAAHPEVEVLDCVDLSAGVIRAAREHFQEANGGVLDDPRVRLIVNDGRTYLLATRERYDVIALEPPPPNSAEAANLYSMEFYRLCRQRLNAGGILVQWVPYHAATFPQACSLTATLQAVFPGTSVWELFDGEEYCILGRMDENPVPLARIAARLSAPSTKTQLEAVGIRGAEDLLACFVMGSQGAAELCGPSRLVTDDRPGLGYDWQAFGLLDLNSRVFWRSERTASILTSRHAEDPARLLSFEDEAERARFARRLEPVRQAARMHLRAAWITGLAPLDERTFREQALGFVPPPLLDPENPYYRYANDKGLYVDALLKSAEFLSAQGRAEEAARLQALAVELDARRRLQLPPGP